MGLVWTEQLSVGNAVIDSDHEKLIGLVNDVRYAIRSRDGFILTKEFVRLEDWLCIHFANEERIARAVDFDFSEHRQEQQYALRELQHLRDELIAKDGLWSDGAVAHFTGFLEHWLIDDHIIGLNMLMKPTLQAHDYAFQPG